jgi:prolyl-tRNA synthetase
MPAKPFITCWPISILKLKHAKVSTGVLIKPSNQSKDKGGIKAKKAENFSEWYVDAIIRSEFVDYSPVSGMMVLRPDSYFIWERVMEATDQMFKKNGVLNTSFPLLIPERLLNREAEHIKHFSAEVAWVTKGGDTELEERLAIRPTSETLMYEVISKWIKSWRDLPMKLNQWNSVVRWEFKHPTPFLRTREFLWNEGHSVYATEKETLAERETILGIYTKILKEYFALPGITGRKTEQEKFAGGVASYSIEHLMPDGWAIQGPDWHFDGQKFAKIFDINFLDKNEKKEYGWQSTYAITTRVIGIALANHGDDKGLIVPPKLSRIQVVIVPIYKNENRDKVVEFANKVASGIGSLRCYVDERDGYSPGWKFNYWELRGVPLRLEIGEKEMASKRIVACSRDTFEKVEVPLEQIEQRASELLDELHERIYKKAEKFLHSMVTKEDDYKKMREILEKKGGMVHAPWCGENLCEDKVKEETGAKITNMPLDQSDLKGNCIYCGRKAKHMANFAKSY